MFSIHLLLYKGGEKNQLLFSQALKYFWQQHRFSYKTFQKFIDWTVLQGRAPLKFPVGIDRSPNHFISFLVCWPSLYSVTSITVCLHIICLYSCPACKPVCELRGGVDRGNPIWLIVKAIRAIEEDAIYTLPPILSDTKSKSCECILANLRSSVLGRPNLGSLGKLWGGQFIEGLPLGVLVRSGLLTNTVKDWRSVWVSAHHFRGLHCMSFSD